MSETLGRDDQGRSLKPRFFVLGLVFLMGLLTLAVRLYRLQITRGEEFAAKSKANYVKEVRIPADRGMILDRRGEILVDNRPSFDVFITPASCDKCATEVLPRLQADLNWTDEEVGRIAEQIAQAKRSAPFRPVAVHLDLTREQLDVLNADKLHLPMIDILPVPHRNYRLGTSMAHVLGYMNEITPAEYENLQEMNRPYMLGDYIGRRGLERFYEEKLHGVDGVRREVVNAKGGTDRDLTEAMFGEEDVEPQPGTNLVLSVDLRLQAEAERAFPGIAGTVIAVEVKTGFIQALVSRPSFDPNVLTGRVTPQQLAAMSADPMQPMVNRAAAQRYSPGSTFKPVTLLAALKSGRFRADTVVNCPGGYRLGARVWRCWKDAGHGNVNAHTAMQHSCDTYFYKIADTIGLDPISQVGKALGFGRDTKVSVFSEVPGIMPSEEYHNRVHAGGYTRGMALNSAIGQGDVTVTPLQLAMAYATIANGGTLYRPQIVLRTEGVEGKVVEEFKPEVREKIEMDPAHWNIVMDSLSAVVNEPGGTAYRQRIPGLPYAGKTGTAQVATLGAVRLKTHQIDFFLRDHAWFAAFAPAQDPELAIVVLNEHGGHGGSDAAPTANAVIKKYFELKALDNGGPAGAQAPPAPAIRGASTTLNPATPIPLVTPYAAAR